MVEFALIITAFFALILGTFSGGSAYDKKLSVTHAAREGARYGAALAPYQTFSPSTTTWAQAIQQVVVARSGGTLSASNVCVSLVTGGTPASPPTPSVAPTVFTPPSGTFTQSDYAQNGGSTSTAPCFDDGSADTGPRVEVSTSATSKLEFMFATMPLTLTSKAIARFEACPTTLSPSCT